jgi:hypothetical protein
LVSTQPLCSILGCKANVSFFVKAKHSSLNQVEQAHYYKKDCFISQKANLIKKYPQLWLSAFGNSAVLKC